MNKAQPCSILRWITKVKKLSIRIASLLFMFVLARRIELIVRLFAERNGAKRDIK